MSLIFYALATLPLAAVAWPSGGGGSSFPKITDLVAFGDSYTDEGRCELFLCIFSPLSNMSCAVVGYFINHQGAPPPVGYVPPIVSSGPICSLYTIALLIYSIFFFIEQCHGEWRLHLAQDRS